MFAGKYDGVSRGEGSGGYDQVERKTINLQYIMMIFGIMSMLVALANFSICIWIRFDLDFWEWILEIEWYRYWNCTYVVMFAMLFTALNSGLLVYGIFVESRFIILMNMILRGLFWFLTFAGVVVICLYGVEDSDILVNELNVVFMNLISRTDEDPRAARVLRMIQEYVGCCGASGNRDDYYNMGKVIPPECRHPVTGNNYSWGCHQTLAWWLEPWTSCLAGISLFFTVTDPLVIMSSVKLRRLMLKLQDS